MLDLDMSLGVWWVGERLQWTAYPILSRTKYVNLCLIIQVDALYHIVIDIIKNSDRFI